MVHAHTHAFTHRAFTHRRFYCIEASSQSRVYTPKLLHRERPLHRAAFTILYAQRHRNFKHANAQAIYTDRSIHTEAYTQKLFTQMRQMLLHTEAFEHRRLYTQKHLPRDALTHTRLYTQKLLGTDCFQIITEALTPRSLYTENLLHTESFALARERSTEAPPWVRAAACAGWTARWAAVVAVAVQRALATRPPGTAARRRHAHGHSAGPPRPAAGGAAAPIRRWRPVPTDRTPTGKKVRRKNKKEKKKFYTHKLFHRIFYTEKLLRTGAFTHRRLYTQKLVHTEAFTHRNFCTEKPLHTDAFPQKNRFHRAAFTRFNKSQFNLSF